MSPYVQHFCIVFLSPVICERIGRSLRSSLPTEVLFLWSSERFLYKSGHIFLVHCFCCACIYCANACVFVLLFIIARLVTAAHLLLDCHVHQKYWLLPDHFSHQQSRSIPVLPHDATTLWPVNEVHASCDLWVHAVACSLTLLYVLYIRSRMVQPL